MITLCLIICDSLSGNFDPTLLYFGTLFLDTVIIEYFIKGNKDESKRLN